MSATEGNPSATVTSPSSPPPVAASLPPPAGGQSLRILTPSQSRLQPFPKITLIVLGVAVLLSIPTSPEGSGAGMVMNVIAKAAASLAMCAIGAWAEQRIYRHLLAKGAFLRVLLTLLLPLVIPMVGSVTLLPSILTALLGDDGTLALAGVLGLAWMSSAAMGSAIIVLIDVGVSAAIKDFRSRVQAAILLLLTVVVGFAVSIYAVGRMAVDQVADAVHRSAEKGEFSVDIGKGKITGEKLLSWLDLPETKELIAAVLLLLVVLVALPTILSACGKLADAVMERLNPLAEAFDEVSAGRLDIRVEQGGSRDFQQITQSFNRMTAALSETMTDLDRRNRDLAEMNRATSRFVPFQFLELLKKQSIREIVRGDQIQLDISIMFADIRGFTTMAERMGPAATFAFINRYLGHMDAEIHREQGFINDFFGDGIMALFHVSADAALRAALGMLAAVQSFNETLHAEGEQPIRVGIGLNSGPLMLGTIGGEQRLSCTVVGDPANLAARVEGMTKLYGAS